MADVVRQWVWRIVLGLALMLGPAPNAMADSGASDWFVTDQGRVRLVAAAPDAVDGARLRLGLEFRLAPHWKIYWRSPGDAGYPPRLDWAGSTNLAAADMDWPAPQRFSVLGLETIGYTDAVVFPIAAKLQRPGEVAHLHLALSYLTCDDICIPYDAVLDMNVAGAGAAGGGNFAALIARYEARVPAKGGSADFKLAGATIATGRHPELALRVAASPPLAEPDAFIEAPAGVAFGKPLSALREEEGVSVLRLPVLGERNAIERLVGEPLTVTLVDGTRALEARVTPAAAPPAGSELGLLFGILPLALLGGLILNLMPCVLPVLSIKLLGVIEQGGRSRRALRLGFLATALGIMLSFLALAGAMAALKTAGVAVGWGVQFQEPLFLIAMVALLTLFAANLWGFFEVRLPAWLGGLAARGDSTSLAGNVAIGAFATLLATPCSAPFLGTAVGFALAAGPLEIVAVFLALGLGLAAPYLLAAMVPHLARFLPRPGRWMLVLRRVMGVALALTALWLVSVLVAEIGDAAALAVGLLMLATAASLQLLRAPLPRRMVPAALVLGAFLVPMVLAVPPGAAQPDAFWQPFDRAELGRAVGAGKLVFVDVTADWCLTCKVNKELVIEKPEVRARLAGPGIIAMRADWTRPSDAIAAYLKSFGRYGIPFNAVYGPAAPQGIALSEVLTPGAVLDALAAAAGAGSKMAGAVR
jgi:suppressor for copper-sensitivity B